MRAVLLAAVDPQTPSASGVRSYVLSLGRALCRMGESVALLCLGENPVEIDGVEIIPVAKSVSTSAQFVFAVAKFLRRWRPRTDDVVHAQRPDDLIPFHLKTPAVPKVVTLHGIHGFHVETRRGRLTGAAYRIGERYSLQRTQAIICVSRSTADYFRGRYPNLSTRLHLISAGLDWQSLPSYNRAEARGRIRLPHESKLITFVGRFEPEKNPVAVLEHALALRRRHKEIRIMIVGDGQLDTELRLRARSAGGAVEIRGPVSQDGLAWLLSASDIVVVASANEGLPTIALESLACGTPVVGTQVGILPDLVRPGVNGYLVPSVEQLGVFMEKALYESTWLASNCRASVQSFGWDRIAPVILEVYRAISS